MAEKTVPTGNVPVASNSRAATPATSVVTVCDPRRVAKFWSLKYSTRYCWFGWPVSVPVSSTPEPPSPEVTTGGFRTGGCRPPFTAAGVSLPNWMPVGRPLIRLPRIETRAVLPLNAWTNKEVAPPVWTIRLPAPASVPPTTAVTGAAEA